MGKIEIKYDIEGKPSDELTKRCQRIVLDLANKEYNIASEARAKGIDAEDFVESLPATNLAERTENITGPKGVAVKYAEFMARHDDNIMKAILEVIDWIIKDLDDLDTKQKKVDQALRTALALYTQAVTVAPLEGLTEVYVKKNDDQTEYIELHFAGPIRSAGGTGAALPVLWADYIRKKLDIDKFKPRKEEIERYAEEVEKYSEIYTRQAKFTTDDVRWIMTHCPIALTGNATENVEVSENRDLERVPTNALRGGALLVIEEGIMLKAPKLYKFAKEMGLEWQWIERVLKVKKSAEGSEKVELKPVWGFLTGGMAAGRPIFAYPMKRGGFRLQYGRARNSGVAAKAVHPATMRVLNDFASIGMQLKMERPGKATCIIPCDSIEGPIVKLRNGDVVKLKTEEQALELRPQVKQILFLGDFLVSYGDFRKTGENLAPCGYNELWWKQEVKKALKERTDFRAVGVDLDKVLAKPREVTQEEAINLSLQLGVPLHPEYIHYYDSLNKEKISALIMALKGAEVVFEGEKVSQLKIADLSVKEIVEDLGLEHKVRQERLVVDKKYAYSLLKTFGLVMADDPLEKLKEVNSEKPLEILSQLSGLTIRDKSGLFIGGRMGRPESESLRTMKGSPQCLFPVGRSGGSTRNLMKAIENGDGEIEVEAALFKCPNCKASGVSIICDNCNTRREQVRNCKVCKAETTDLECGKCKEKTLGYVKQKMPARDMVMSALKRMGEKTPKSVKGVIALWSDDRIAEPIEKGILRAKHGIFIYQDGLSRYEMLNLPITHARLKEIGLSVEKAREIGYDKDFQGRPLEEADQIIELFVQDIVINEGERGENGEPSEGCAEYFVKLSQFLDEELMKVYGLAPYYNCRVKEDLIGKLIIGLAPHTSAASIGRIVGFTKARAHFAHPYYHMAKRRNCDGEQDSYTLLLDLLLNFSKRYLPSRRGGKMDAALVTTVIVDAGEIDDEVYEMETVDEYPLELYEAAQKMALPHTVQVPIVKDRIGKANQYNDLKYTHDVSNINAGPRRSSYTSLKSMDDKVEQQLDLQDKIRAVDEVDAAEKVVSSHLVRDIMGNMRAFALQKFRCVGCNESYRRIPLSGRCPECNGNVILTISRGTVEKYLHLSQGLVNRYPVRDYLKQRIALLSEEVHDCFKDSEEVTEKKKQRSLADFA